MGRFPGRREWTSEEDAKLIELIDRGVRRIHLPAHFADRTDAAVKSRARTLRPPEPNERAVVTNASAALRVSLISLMAKMDAGLVAELLGRPPAKQPGTERVYKTAAIERLAA